MLAFEVGDKLAVDPTHLIATECDAPTAQEPKEAGGEYLPDDAQEGCPQDEAPDGGLVAWGTVFVSFVIHICTPGLLYSFGIFSAHYVAEGVDTAAVISLVGSTATASMMAPSLLCGYLAERYGFRVVMFFGSLLMGTAYVAASFCTKVSYQLFLTQGVLYGLGACLAYIPALSLPAQWFTKRKAIANGLGVAGGGVGGIVIALVNQRLISAVGIEWTLRITAAALTVSTLAVLPLAKTRVAPTRAKFDGSLFRTTRFGVHLGSTFFNMFPCFIPAFFLPLYARDVVGLSVADGAALVAIFNASSAVGRLAVGVVADAMLGRVNTLILCNLTSALSGFFVWSFANTYAALVVFAVVNGITLGGFWSLLPVLASQSFGVERLPSVLGMMLSISSVAFLVGPPLTGFIRDRVGYVGVAVFSGGLNFVAFLFACALRQISPSLPPKEGSITFVSLINNLKTQI
ncbi:major facilitator superfamily domain-containing protein [Chytriomyces sp. MP71]|nr:major facilitator superfamily domain-containing protein [Chytriomyces sp. MP71]